MTDITKATPVRNVLYEKCVDSFFQRYQRGLSSGQSTILYVTQEANGFAIFLDGDEGRRLHHFYLPTEQAKAVEEGVALSHSLWNYYRAETEKYAHQDSERVAHD